MTWAADPLSLVSCKVGPTWIRLVFLAHPRYAQSDRELGNLETELVPWSLLLYSLNLKQALRWGRGALACWNGLLPPGDTFAYFSEKVYVVCNVLKYAVGVHSTCQGSTSCSASWSRSSHTLSIMLFWCHFTPGKGCQYMLLTVNIDLHVCDFASNWSGHCAQMPRAPSQFRVPR